LLKETTGAFDGSRKSPPHYESDVQPTAPQRSLMTFYRHIEMLRWSVQVRHFIQHVIHTVLISMI